MPINFQTLLKAPPCWARRTPHKNDIVLTTMVRLVRNLPGHRFPGWSTAEDRAAVAEKILPVLLDHPKFRYCHRAEMTELNYEDRCILLERKQITPSLAARQDGCHLILSRDQKICAMVNEEEHLCVHVCTTGFSPKRVMDTAADIARHLESNLSLAHTPQNGYLTSMPQETGEGLQLFAVLHLPMLYLTGQMEKVGNALEQMHLNITPFSGDADESGNLYVLYTPPIPLGLTTVMEDHFQYMCTALAQKEQQVSTREFENYEGLNTYDLVYRSFGLLSYACSIDYRELISALSMIRMGLRYFLLSSSDVEDDIFVVPKEILHLYELSPAYLRRKDRRIQNVYDALTRRGDKVRLAMKTIHPILPM